MADIEGHQRKLREHRERLYAKPSENELRREELAKEIRTSDRDVTQAHLDALADLVRVTMPGAVRTAFTDELRALQAEVRDGGRRDNFARGVWAGWASLLTELIVRIEREAEPSIENLDLLAKEPPGFA